VKTILIGFPAGEDIPVLLQQAPKSLGQGSATVLRGLLDPELEGKDNHVTDMYSILIGEYEIFSPIWSVSRPLPDA
jgi:hypothetical protein